MKQIKAIGYGRTSSEDQSENKVSVDVQRKEFEAACKANGWEMVSFEEDRDFSGRTYPLCGKAVYDLDTVTQQYLNHKNSTKVFRKGLSAALESGADILWCRDSTRFARPLSGSMLAPYLRGELQRRNMTLWAGNAPVDYTQFSTVLTETIKDLSEDHGIKTKIAQSKASIRAKRDKGEIFRNPDMFGFRSAGHGKLSAVVSELETVKTVYKLFIEGMGLNTIARKLNSEKVPTMLKGLWSFSTVKNILVKPIYAGYQMDSKGNLVESPIYKPFAVITLSDYHKAHSILNGQSRPKWQGKYIHPLQGLIYCGYCGHQMGIYKGADFDTRKPTHYYRCDWSTYQTKDEAGLCRKTLIRETLGIPAKLGQIKGYLSKDGKNPIGTGLIEMLFPFVIQGYVSSLKAKASQGELETSKTNLLAQLETLKAKQTQRYLDKENGLLDADTYATLAKSLIFEKNDLETQLKTVQKSINSITGFQLTVDDLDTLKGVTAIEYSQLIKQAVERVTIYSDKITVTLKDGNDITLERIQDRNARLCPKPEIILPIDLTDSEETEDTDTQITIRYHYKNKSDEINTLCKSNDYAIYTLGNNNPSKSTLKKRATLAKKHAL